MLVCVFVCVGVCLYINVCVCVCVHIKSLINFRLLRTFVLGSRILVSRPGIHSQKSALQSFHTVNSCRANFRECVLQWVIVCCSVLQCVAVCCSVLQCVAVFCGVLQCVAVNFENVHLPSHEGATHMITVRHHCDIEQHTATHCNTLQHIATHCSTLHTLQHTAAHCSILQHTAAHCSILQHTAAHCNTLQLTQETQMINLRHSSHCRL